MSKKIIIGNDKDIWRNQLVLAQEKYDILVPEKINFFLEDLLSRYINQPSFNDHSFTKIALLAKYFNMSAQEIADTADSCLFYIGLFPNRMARYNLDPKHFVNIGQILYHHVEYHPLYDNKDMSGTFIANHYVDMVDSLLSFRESIWENEPIPKEYAYKLWLGSGSKYALKHLK